MNTLPPLRNDIDLMPFRSGDRDLILVRDPLGIAPENAALAAEVVPFLPLFDGASTVGDLQIALMRQRGGAIVYRSDAERIVGELSRAGILQTEEYREAKRRIVADFVSRRERPAALAGSAYPADPRELTGMLDRILSLDAPGPSSLPGPLRGLACPHIDLRVAERTYAAAFRSIRGVPPPSAVLLLGTGHALGETRYCVSGKSFTTPLGGVPADWEGAERLRRSGGDAASPDDFPHRSEHSIEFPLLFLQRVHPMERIPILPVLCGPMEDLFGRVRSPLEVEGIASFVDAASAWLSAPPGNRIVVAGVDFSHVGPKFGDSRPASAFELSVRAYDREMLDALAAGDADAFFRIGARERNRFRICGFSALWTLLAVSPGIRGTVLEYGLWHEEPTRSAVSFAAVAFAAAPVGGSGPSGTDPSL
ncbi:MAG: AmmeMemoRadiSam system protein B [Deltaproteobacteria bacterium]